MKTQDRQRVVRDLAFIGPMVLVCAWFILRGRAANAGALAVVCGMVLLLRWHFGRMRSRSAAALRGFRDWSDRYAVLYRLIASTPEYARFPDPDVRHAAVQELNYGVLTSWWYATVALIACLALFLAAERAARWLSHAIPLIPWIAGYVAAVLLGLAIFFALLWLFIRYRVRVRLRERLAALGVPICVHCGYDLRGQTEPRCPECGRTFDPKLLRARDKQTGNSGHAAP